MPNETSSDASATPPSDSQPATGNAPSGATPREPSVTLEDALAQIAELKRTHAELDHAYKNASGELKRHREKLTTYEKAEQEAKDAELSELERIKKQHSELQATHDTYSRQMQERIIRYEVERQAAKMHVIDPDAAVKLLDLSELEYDEQGTPTNADKLLEKLLKSKPYLAPKLEEPATPEPPARGTPALPAMNPGRSSIAAPDSFPPGKIPRLSDVYRRP